MQIAQLKTTSGISSGNSTSTSAVDEPALVADKETAASASASATATRTGATAPLRRGLTSWDHQLQGEISSAQQALDFLEQSASQLQSLKSELAARLASHQGREGQVEARVRQFSNTWRERSNASGGTLDSQLDYSSPEPANQRFSIRGLTMANLQAGGKEVLAFSVNGSTQSLRSVNIEPGLSDVEILQRFNQALAPDKVQVSAKDDGTLVFSTPENMWATMRDTLAVRGGGFRFPAGQLSRVKTDEETPAITPDQWGTDDTEALRHTLQQVVQALAQVQRARESVSKALAQASRRVDSAQPVDIGIGMDRLAQNFTETANEPGYRSLLAITSALAGLSRERVISLLRLQ